ncbi:unnamed protein product [Caenorhabditis angaria]|uniref:Ionotropic glutamate receptor L-glutamate and glycine-binding domain-containing protein n=1 Tax=Caenorhabditis angaria TaxID=860376 RepID=A0A9P1N977_9PELO|nr:unnamed protein product [Caenorhabditis angaria]
MSENIRVGVFPLEKDAQTCFERPDCKHPGAEVEILKMVFRLIKVNYTLLDVWKEFGEQYDFGAKQKNGSWSGMIGLLHQGKLDMIGLSMRMSSEREEAVLFSYPTRVFESIFIIAPPSLTCTRQFIFNAFSRTVWICIILTFMLFYAFSILMNYARVRNRHDEDFKFSKYFIDFFNTSISTFPVSNRLILLITLFATFIFSQLYQTDMYAFLSVPLSYDIPFRSIKEALDIVERKKMYFAAFDAQTLLCTPATCNRYEQVTKKNPVRRGETEKEVQDLILKGGIYQSTVDSDLLPGKLAWLTTNQEFLIIRDEDAPSYYVAFSFAKSHKKLLRKFNNALIEVLPAVSTITTGHGYNTKKLPFEMRTANPRAPLSFLNHLLQLFRSFSIAMFACIIIFLLEYFYVFLKNHWNFKSFDLP